MKDSPKSTLEKLISQAQDDDIDNQSCEEEMQYQQTTRKRLISSESDNDYGDQSVWQTKASRSSKPLQKKNQHRLDTTLALPNI